MENRTPAEMNRWQTLTVLSLTTALLVICKFDALVLYFQQAHQTVLPVENVPRIPYWRPAVQWQDHVEQTLGLLVDQAQARLLTVGKVTLAGERALPVVEKPAATTETCKNTQGRVTVAASAPVAAPSAALASAMDTLVRVKTQKASEVTTEESDRITLKSTDRVLLAGDSMMQGVAPHLASTLRRQYGIETVNLSRQSTGLAYPNFFDWPATVRKEFQTGHYSALVMLLGANDTWDIIQKGRAVPFGTDHWKTAYRERVADILEAAQQHDVRVIWLGAPPMGREKMADRVPLLNEMYSLEVARHPHVARFVSSGAVLSPDGNSFSKFLELPPRGKVMVRADDGVHFTPTGQRLLAKLTLAQFSLPQITESPQ